jgi:hypothetical protein
VIIPPPQGEGVNAMRSIALTGGGRRMIARPHPAALRAATLPASRGGMTQHNPTEAWFNPSMMSARHLLPLQSSVFGM